MTLGTHGHAAHFYLALAPSWRLSYACSGLRRLDQSQSCEARGLIESGPYAGLTMAILRIRRVPLLNCGADRQGKIDHYVRTRLWEFGR
jgi:hypothetical protein